MARPRIGVVQFRLLIYIILKGVKNLFCQVPDAVRRGGQKNLPDSPSGIVGITK